MSEKTMVDFIIATGRQTALFFHALHSLILFALAQKASSPDALFASLQGAGAPSDSNAQRFAYELFGRVPHKQSKSAAAAAAAEAKAQRKREEKEAAKLRKANESFRTILEEPADTSLDKDEERRLKKKEKKLRKKRKQESAWESDDDTEVKTTERKRRKDKKGTSPRDACVCVC